MISPDIYFEIEQEVKQTPTLLNIIHAFREGVCTDQLNSDIQSMENETQTPFDDLFGMIKTTRTVSLEEIEQAISEQGLERFNERLKEKHTMHTHRQTRSPCSYSAFT